MRDPLREWAQLGEMIAECSPLAFEQALALLRDLAAAAERLQRAKRGLPAQDDDLS